MRSEKNRDRGKGMRAIPKVKASWIDIFVVWKDLSFLMREIIYFRNYFPRKHILLFSSKLILF